MLNRDDERKEIEEKVSMRRIWLWVLAWFVLLIAPARADVKDVAAVVSMSPTSGEVGTPVDIIVRNLKVKPKIDFNGVPAEIASIKTLNATDVVIKTSAPSKDATGAVTLTLPDKTTIPAGSFTIIKPPTQLESPPAPNPHTLPPGSTPNSRVGGSAPNTSSGSNPQGFQGEKDLDLPVEPYKLEPAIPKPPENPPPLGPPPPTIYGKDLISESGSAVYVIDISGSMSSDAGQYVDAEGKVKTGSRLDRAKAELAKSIRSLPKNFKFNVLAYDCSNYFWKFIPVQATDAEKQSAIAWVNKLEPNSATATGPAVAAALQAKDNKLIILLTDGAPNCGVTPSDGSADCLVAHEKMIKDHNTQGATINVFGIGAYGVFKQFCLDIASASGGSYTDVK